MAVTFSGTNGLFTRLGRLFSMAALVRTHQAALRTEVADVVSQYSDADMDMVNTILNTLEDRVKSAGVVLQDIKKDAEKTLIEMVDDELATSGEGTGGLRVRNVKTALQELVRNMEANSATVDGTTITINSATKTLSHSSATGVGDLLLTGMAPRRLTDDITDYPTVKSELIRATCIRDANHSSVTEGAEGLRGLGQRPEERLSEKWPKGSGVRTTLTAANSRYSEGKTPGANVLKNSSFEDFTSNAPDSWTIVTGAAGSTIDDKTAGHYMGDSSLKYVSNGSLLLEIKQEFNSISGTMGTLQPDKPYSISFAIKRSGSPSAGVIDLECVDSGGTVLNNGVTGREMKVSIAHNNAKLTTGWVMVTQTCYTPLSIPKGSYFRIKMSTAFTNTIEIYIDNLCLAEMPRLYPGGLAAQIVSAADPFQFDDEIKIDVDNNDEGDFLQEFDRFYNIGAYNLALPSHYGGSETIADSLIT